MCPSSLENGKLRKGRTKGEWGAGAHLVARGVHGVRTRGVCRVQGCLKGLKPISSPSHPIESIRFYVTLPCSF